MCIMNCQKHVRAVNRVILPHPPYLRPANNLITLFAAHNNHIQV